jgi:hypothetical protein
MVSARRVDESPEFSVGGRTTGVVVSIPEYRMMPPAARVEYDEPPEVKAQE